MVDGAFKAILGESSAGEHESQQWFIVPVGYAFYRIDTFMWKWNVQAESGLHKRIQSVSVTMSGCGVLDHTKIKKDELIAFIQQSTGKNAKAIIKWLNEFNTIVSAIRDLNMKEMKMEGMIYMFKNTRSQITENNMRAENI